MYNKFMTSMVLFALLISLFAPINVSAHILKTALGKNVNHGHYGYCGPNGCPLSDSWFEKKYGFLLSEKKYSGTGQWNCHGRTFDLKQSWIPLAELYLETAVPMTPAYPQIGDTIIFWQNGKTSHSATIVGSWNGLYTQVMSKYGTQGQYKSSLIKMIPVYSSSMWSVIRFYPATKIYTTIRKSMNLVASLTGAQSLSSYTFDLNNILKQREKMPWYKDVLESEKIAAVEHTKVVNNVSAMTEENKKAYNTARNLNEKIAILIKDIKDIAHYAVLGAYERPDFSADFITAIEAGKLLVETANKYPEMRPLIINELKKVVFIDQDPYQTTDQKSGAALFFLSQIMPDTEKAAFKQEVLNKLQSEKFFLSGEETFQMRTYRDFYLNRM